MIVKQLPQTELIDAVVGVSDATLQALSLTHCADCGAQNEKAAMYYVPFGTHAICRTCRDRRLTEQR